MSIQDDINNLNGQVDTIVTSLPLYPMRIEKNTWNERWTKSINDITARITILNTSISEAQQTLMMINIAIDNL